MRTRPVETALITGAGSGMGRAAALRLARAGRTVFMADIDLTAARAVAQEVACRGGRAEALVVDVASSSSVAGLFEAVLERAPRLDLVVHAAGILGQTAWLDELSDEGWRRLMAVNLDGTFFCCREAVRHMKERGGGRIVLFSSVASLTPTPGAVAYSAAKGAVNMLARSLAAEAARHNVRVNVIAPGYVDTPMLEGLPPGFCDHILKRTPLKRLGTPEEIAALVGFLASPEADFFTGQVFSPNGGLVM
ncbi:SDR family NAD(P)-dependent oxidoreductase [Deferrisoma camini]|uniref:SDR family NAD(P)-dependent oxidoreductase n=1 Tax=Deferrisoma camini TaxID=1035120 RepID=UPI00046D580A|nr:SDR family NAD(P)-dependent oxidoreductase [Deferrisoma camini]